MYVSFGSVFFPAHVPGQFATLLNVLLDGDRPFVLSQAALMFPSADEETAPLYERLQKAHADGRCYVDKWIPQQQLLAHAAVGVFLTHGGWNSTCETMAHGVPAVYWPLTADQATIANDA